MPTNTPAILAIETSSMTGSAAAVRGDAFSIRKCGEANRHSENVIAMADAALGDIGAALSSCSAVAFGAGPGAFTGLRVACGVAQGFAWGAGIPNVAVGNLEALAVKALAERYPGTRVMACLDARMSQAYCAVYEKTGGPRPLEVRSPVLLNPAELAGFAREAAASVAAGSGVREYGSGLEDSGILTLPGMEVDALDIARLAIVLFEEGLAVPPAQAAPLYVRNRVALTTSERAAGERL